MRGATLRALTRRTPTTLPLADGEVERFNRTLQAEWAYQRIFTSNTARTEALAPLLKHYNSQRRHSALEGQPPISRLP